MKTKAKKLVRKLPPPKKVARKVPAAKKAKVAKPVAAPVVVAEPKDLVLRTTPDGIRLSRVQVSPEGIVLKVLD